MLGTVMLPMAVTAEQLALHCLSHNLIPGMMPPGGKGELLGLGVPVMSLKVFDGSTLHAHAAK